VAERSRSDGACAIGFISLLGKRADEYGTFLPKDTPGIYPELQCGYGAQHGQTGCTNDDCSRATTYERC